MVGKTTLMKRNTVFFANLNHIGPIQIITDGQNATVISILGIRRFNFSKLPHNRNNKYTILKLSMKTYMNSVIDRFDSIVDMPRHKSSFLGFIKNLITPLALESGNYIERLRGLIIKDRNDFSEDCIKNFMEIDCSENILDVFHIPVLVYFENFEESLFFDQNSLSVSSREMNAVKVTSRDLQNDEKKHVLRNFIISEIRFYIEIRDFYKDRCEDTNKFNSVLQVMEYYKNIVAKLSDKFLIRGDDEFLENLQHDGQQIWNENEISSKEIACVYLSVSDMINSHLDFITEYEISCDDIDQQMREKITMILSKTTNYSKVFAQICEVDDSEEARKASVMFYKANKFLNHHSEKMHLKLIVDNLKTRPVLSGENLLAALDCKLSGNSCRLCLTEESLFIINQENMVVFSGKLDNTDIILYNKIVYILSGSAEVLEVPFSPIKPTKSILVVLESINRETTNEFCEKVHVTKYNCSKTDEFYYYYKGLNCTFTENSSKIKEKTIELRNTPNTYLFDNSNQILVSKLDEFSGEETDFADKNSQEHSFTIKIEGMYFRTGGIIQLNEKELLEKVKEEVILRRTATLNLQNTLYAIVSIMNNVDQNRLKQFYLDIYPEDDVSFTKKRDLFLGLYQSILGFENEASDFLKAHSPGVLVDFTKHLYSNDILGRYEENIKDYFIRRYLNILYSGYNQTTTKFGGIEEVVVLFSMLIQRNLYYFLDVNDLEKLNKDFLASGCIDNIKSLKPYTVENFIKITQVIDHLRKIKRNDLIDTITCAIF